VSKCARDEYGESAKVKTSLTDRNGLNRRGENSPMDNHVPREGIVPW